MPLKPKKGRKVDMTQALLTAQKHLGMNKRAKKSIEYMQNIK